MSHELSEGGTLPAPVEILEVRRLLAVGSAGTIDPTFGQGGIAALHLDRAIPTGVTASTPLPGGKLLEVGDYFADENVLALARFNPDGTPDDTFGRGGLVLARGVPARYPSAVLADHAGRIYVTGAADGRPEVVRLEPDGRLDTSFGHDGIAMLRTAPGGATPEADQHPCLGARRLSAARRLCHAGHR